MSEKNNFIIHPAGAVAAAFLSKGVGDFMSAVQYIKTLPYRRNEDKDNLLAVLEDGFGTCSTKHALLKVLAMEHQAGNVRLMMGMYRMNGDNTPSIKNTLDQCGLTYIPEAHNYLRIDGVIYDCTKSTSSEEGFLPDLLEETDILPSQINSYKIQYHKGYLGGWLREHPEIGYDLEQLWTIRERCISALSSRD